MKTRKLLTGIILLFLVFSVASSQAYTPQDEGDVEVLIMANPDNVDRILENSVVDFFVFVKNLTNDTISNITVTQELPTDAELVSFGSLTLFDDKLSLTDTTVEDNYSDKQLQFNYLNITKDNFTGNIDISMPEDDYFVLSFSVNVTTTGTFNFERPAVSFYDHWGDMYSDTVGQATSIRVIADVTDSRLQYFPAFEVMEPAYGTILLLAGALLVVALIARVAYFKKPFEI